MYPFYKSHRSTKNHQGGVEPCLVDGDRDPRPGSLENLVLGVLPDGVEPL